MIKKLISSLFLILIFLLISLILTLSTIGIKTNKFNKLISDKISKTKNINLELNDINFGLDPKRLSLFLETSQPKINYNNLLIPTQNIKVYIDFLTMLKGELKIKKIKLDLDEINSEQIKKLSIFLKPSNFKVFLNNKIKGGKLLSEIDIFLNDDGSLNNYITRGFVKDLKTDLFSELELSQTNFNFFADKEDILIKNIFGNINNIKISNGDIKLNLENGIKVSSNFDSKINLDDKILKNYFQLLKKYKLMNQIKLLNGNFSHIISIDFDDTYKLKKYNYYFSGKIQKSKFALSKPINNNIISEEIKELYLKDFEIESNITTSNYKIAGKGKYSFNDKDFLRLEVENSLKEDLLKLNGNFDFKNKLNIDLINYSKSEGRTSNISFDFEKVKNISNFKRIRFKENSNSIDIDGLKFKDNKFLLFKEIDVKTSTNNFFIKWDKKILIKGTLFDATNLPKLFNNQDNNKYKNINNFIEIDFKKIKAPFSEQLENFKLIGKIEKGKFVKISSKGDFGENNFLDITLKKDKESEKRFLEIYSDLPRPLLAGYKFFNGLSGGKLLFTSLIEGSKSNSKLRIENFKIINAPGLIKLLSLADLGGLVDLAEGEGLSFKVLEIDMEKDKNFLKLNEILALGPSMSVLMEGYQDETGLTSLRGTLVPAKTLNKIISKIPVIGKIVIPKEVGEGLFGISFKIKGPKGSTKTTINPIRTLTPRFIQKIIDRTKKPK